MRETMLHIDRDIDPGLQARLCRALQVHGGDCETRHRSSRPRLLFVRYDELRGGPGVLVEAARSAGVKASVVDG